LVPDIGSFDLTMTLLRSYSRAANASDWMRLLHHAASKTTADLCGSAVVSSIDEAGNGGIETEQYWKAVAPRSRAPRDGHAGYRPLN
jgi:hypothetical protein